MTQPVYDVFVRSNEATYRCETLAESTHNKVYLVAKSKMVANTTSLFSKHTETVSLVNHNRGIIFMFQTNNLGKVCKISLHGENTIDNNKFYCLGTTFLKLFLKIFHVVVLILKASGKRKSASVHNGSVIAVVANDIVFTTSETRNNTTVYAEAG